MKNTLLFIGYVLTVSSSLAQTIIPQPSQRKVQVAILFDTSNSMDGLIDQAKSKIWNIVNDLTGLRHQGQVPTIEIALYDYGNSGLNASANYVRKQIDLTTDLDAISQKLFGLSTNGGAEYCGGVISASLSELEWTNHPQDLRLIYIAGNEPFNQGPVDYKEVCALAANKDITVNTIYCGDYDQGVRELWYDGAKLGKGDYFNINSNEVAVHIQTPYDDKINAYNDSLNRTYYGYGDYGASGKMNQSLQDHNAASESVSTKAERAIVKSKSAYENSSWDLIDAVTSEKADVTQMDDKDLPDEFKGLSDEAKKELIEKKSEERKVFQTQISELAKKRSEYIEQEKKNGGLSSDDFGSSVQKSMMKRAENLGYEKETMP
jgi:hypothetical protein